MTRPRRGDVWWGESPDAKRRPYVVLTRDTAIDVMRTVLVAPITRTVRRIPTEVLLGVDEGLDFECAASFDNILTFPKAMLVSRAGALGAARHHELCRALAAATDC